VSKEFVIVVFVYTVLSASVKKRSVKNATKPS
jgi:hypothetical protein